MEIYIASNNGDIGGGEVMLLNLARALRSLGQQVTVLGPSNPSELLEASRDEGFTSLAIPASKRREYALGLRLWRRANPEKFLWCNGLLPAVATAGLGPRLVHLHQLPQGTQKLAARLARHGALATLVPSTFMAQQLPGTEVLDNWVQQISSPPTGIKSRSSTISVGFLGRVSEIKGTDLLAEAIYRLNRRQNQINFRLVIGGEARFVSDQTQDRVEKALAKLGDSVVTLGWVEPEDFLNQIDCLAVPSQWQEPFGLVAAEAMSARTPLLVTDSGALPSLVGPDYPWIAERGSWETIAKTLLDLAGHIQDSSQELECRVTENYWRWYENYSPEAGKERLRNILLRLES